MADSFGQTDENKLIIMGQLSSSQRFPSADSAGQVDLQHRTQQD